MHKDTAVIILAAGEGKRMKSDCPKVIHDLMDKPMVNYVVEAAEKLSPKDIIIVVGRKHPEVRDVLPKGVTVVYQASPRGTADAVKCAKKALRPGVKNIIVLYGDTPLITERTIGELYAFHKEKDCACTVLTAFLDNPAGYGRILRNGAGQFIGIVEDKDAGFSQKAIAEINTGMYVFDKGSLLEGLEHVKPFNQSGEFYLTDVVGGLFHKNKKIGACPASDSFEVLGVNSPAELRAAAGVLRVRLLDSFAEAGVVIMDYATTFIHPSATIDAGTEVLPFTFIEKDVCVGRDCSIGPYAHLREGTVLRDNVSVGNFAEIKNSVLEDGVRMHHVGYLGDTKVGQKTNIGAGTVVANFDGRKKNRTLIKEKAFIGCDAVLIAPVVIGKNAVVGAGSVVTRGHHVRDGATVAGVPARELNVKRS